MTYLDAWKNQSHNIEANWGVPFDPIRAKSDPDYALDKTGFAVYNNEDLGLPTSEQYYNNKGYWDAYLDGNSGSHSEGSEMMQMLNSLLSMSNSMTEAQNKLQLQMMREANGVTVAEGRRQREFNAAEALKAFERSEQSRLSAQDYNTRERLAAQEWQEHMSNTQYQRAVKDLYEAGLNPLLAVGAQASYGNVSPGRSSASQGYAASSSSGRGTSGSAYRSNVESLINGVLSYLNESERIQVLKDGNMLGLLENIIGSSLGMFKFII